MSKQVSSSIIVALSNFKIVGCVDAKDYRGAEHSYPHGWKELTDQGVKFDQVDIDLPSQEMAQAYVNHFNPGEKTVVIKAEVHSDDCVYEVDFDALPWFQQANYDEIMALANYDWGGDYEADVVAEYVADSDEKVSQLFDYVEAKESMGFECHVDKDSAMAWLKEYRPDIHNGILDQQCWDAK